MACDRPVWYEQLRNNDTEEQNLVFNPLADRIRKEKEEYLTSTQRLTKTQMDNMLIQNDMEAMGIAPEGSFSIDTISNQLYVCDGSTWNNITAVPNNMVGALVVKTPAGEEMDVCATILAMQARIEELEQKEATRQDLRKKINNLSDELDVMSAARGSNVTINLRPALLEDILTDQDKEDSFNRAMGGI